MQEQKHIATTKQKFRANPTVYAKYCDMPDAQSGETWGAAANTAEFGNDQEFRSTGEAAPVQDADIYI